MVNGPSFEALIKYKYIKHIPPSSIAFLGNTWHSFFSCKGDASSANKEGTSKVSCTSLMGDAAKNESPDIFIILVSILWALLEKRSDPQN